MAARKKDLTYKVWIEIEEYNNETGDSSDMDAPGASVATFKTYKEAYEYAGRLQEIGETL